MCGIAGIFAHGPSGPAASHEELRAMRDHMAARGPDGLGEWFSDDGRVGLGHRRLSIIDLSERGAQPMHSADGQLVITFNGEIYNYRQLRERLEAGGHRFNTASDTEVILKLYAEMGESMLHELRGMFAFALWDGARKRLLLARDAFGIKPLYYADGAGCFRFASQVKALLCAPVDRSPSPAGHVGFFLWGSVPDPFTLYRGIRSLPAGHTLSIDASGVGEPVAFCRVPDILRQASEEPATGSREAALEAVAEAIHDSVVAHHVADVPIGVFLSAGLDSAMIASSAARHGARPHTLTLGFREFSGSANDEVPLAEQLAGALGTDQSTQFTGRDDFEGEREKLFAAMDQPSIDGVNTWFVSRAAAQLKLKVALSGLGGDELFASYPSFTEVPELVRLGRPLANSPRVGRALRAVSAPVLRRFTSSKYAGLLEYSNSMGSAYLLRRCLFTPWELPNVLDAELVTAGLEELSTHASLARTTVGIRTDRLAVSALEMEWYTRNQLLRDSDWAGMAHGLEIRVPFLDVELLRKTAPWFAAHPGLRKPQVAAAATPGLPVSFLSRPKTGFSVPVREWMQPPGEPMPERGLRGWARLVHRRLGEAAL